MALVLTYSGAAATEIIPLENTWRDQIDSLRRSTLRILLFKKLPAELIDAISDRLPRHRVVAIRRRAEPVGSFDAETADLSVYGRPV